MFPIITDQIIPIIVTLRSLSGMSNTGCDSTLRGNLRADMRSDPQTDSRKNGHRNISVGQCSHAFLLTTCLSSYFSQELVIFDFVN